MEFDLDKTVNHRVALLAVLLKRQVFRIIAENNLSITPDQWVVMYYLWQENGLTVGELAVRARKDFANTTRIVDKLIKMDYMSKKKNDQDGRSSHVFILPKADEIKEKIQSCWRESSDIAMQGISADEQKTMLGIIDKMERNIIDKLK